MRIHNPEIADLLNRLADLLEIKGANPFRIRAYRTAARVISDYPQSMSDLVKKKVDLAEIPGIGNRIAKKITTIVKTGRLPQLEQLEKHTPRALTELLKIEGMGPKRVKKLYQRLHIKNIHDLKRAIDFGKIAKLKGFGAKTEAMILRGIGRLSTTKPRIKLVDAEKIATTLMAFIRQIPGIKKAEIAGSFRRRKDTVGDLDVLAVATRGAQVIDKFIQFDEISQVSAHGVTKSTVYLHSGVQVDLRVVPEKSYGAALHYFTGSKSHNIAIRRMALKKNMKVNEYGVFKGKKQIAGRTEKEFYALFDLPYIEPELRENRGEIEAAYQHRLPKLIRLEDIRGDLHCHTKETDGKYSLEDMVKAARDRNYEYLAITDHSKHLSVARGFDSKRLSQQLKLIDRLNRSLAPFTILKSIELDILENGQLDLPNSILKELDLTVCAIHYKFNLSKKKQTERILRAMDNPYFNILAHPSGRLISVREGYELDMERIMQGAKDRGCILEINAQPERMDLDDIHCKMAKEMGIKMAISTDAHSVNHFDHIRFGVDIARRGWLEKKDVINAQPLKLLKKNLRRK